MKRSIAFLALFALCLAGCESKTAAVGPTAGTAAPENTQEKALERAAEAGLLPTEEQAALSEQDALTQVIQSLDTAQYTVTLTDEQLSVGSEAAEAHEYFVFEVKDALGEAVGRIAVDRATGDKYNYLGEGTLDDYTSFPLYDPAADAVCDWAGTYEGPAGVTLAVLQGDPNSFEFSFSDGTVGNAHITGSTAKSADGELSFLFGDNMITVAGGTVMGNYAAVQVESTAEPAVEPTAAAEPA